MAQIKLSQTLACPIPVALPKGKAGVKYYKSGTPVFSFGNQKSRNAERWGEMLTAYDSSMCPAYIHTGSTITFLGVTTESTMGQDVASVQGAGVVNISGHAFSEEIDVDDLQVTDCLIADVAQYLKLTSAANAVGPILGTICEVYRGHAKSIESVDVKLTVSMSRQYLHGAGMPAIASASVTTAAVAGTGSGGGGGGGSGSKGGAPGPKNFRRAKAGNKKGSRSVEGSNAARSRAGRGRSGRSVGKNKRGSRLRTGYFDDDGALVESEQESSEDEHDTDDEDSSDTEPEDAAPEDAAPEDAAPEDAAPEDAAPEDAAPEDASQIPRRFSLRRVPQPGPE